MDALYQEKIDAIPLLELEGITKAYAGVKALNNVSFRVQSGRVHGLIGANGAGKSTLIKVLAGVEMPDSGVIYMDGEQVRIANPHISTMLGLSFIHQELSLIEHFNVIENITLGLPKKTKFGLIDWQYMRKKVQNVIDRINLKVPLNTPVKELSIADQWLVSIGRALFQNAKFIAMDEPTASLSESEVAMLFEVIRDITINQNIAVVYVSHRLDEIMEICDEITVMKDGQKVLHSSTNQMSKAEIIDSIAGFHVAALKGKSQNHDDEHVILELDHISDGGKVKDVSLKLHQGEILGLSGLVGAGRTELAQIIFGVKHQIKGNMKFNNKDFNPENPMDAIKRGIALIPEDRRTEGLILNKNVNFNLNLPNLGLIRPFKWLPVISLKRASKISRELIQRLHIKTNTEEAPILSLSGGNQQKVVIGKWLERNPELVIMDEPTRGVDVGARSEIYSIIIEMSKRGISFLIISSDVEELPGLCDRVIVMVEGRVSGELENTMITKEAILKLSFSNNDKKLHNDGIAQNNLNEANLR
ncbi:MAG: sugar ABC transporter ATP-binding protein [Paenibacillaceae bacterium]